jgi:hypothetical protein
VTTVVLATAMPADDSYAMFRIGEVACVQDSDLRYSRSIVIACPAETLYGMVSEVTRMGEWSPVCKACWWDEGNGPWVGGWFTGRNEAHGRVWETRCQVTAASRGREFAFAVRGTMVGWSYAFSQATAGTQVTESWAFLPDGAAAFRERYGAGAEDQIATRRGNAVQGIAQTLAALRAAAENGR